MQIGTTRALRVLGAFIFSRKEEHMSENVESLELSEGTIFSGSTEEPGKPWPEVTAAIEEALLSAITAARNGLQSTMVDWKLHEITCRSGGILDNHIATVSISAIVPKDEE
jgi:hypothetical protein